MIDIQTKSNLETDKLLVSLRLLAEKENIPIMSMDGVRFIAQIVLLKDVKNILEIGTAIGHTSIYLAQQTNANITSIERDIDMMELARKHVDNSNLSERIRLIHDDALFFDPMLIGPFDMIIIDAAKAQNQYLFERYESRLNKNGVIIVDNLRFHDVTTNDASSRQLRALIRKIEEFEAYILSREDYMTVIYPLGDGMSVSIRKD